MQSKLNSARFLFSNIDSTNQRVKSKPNKENHPATHRKSGTKILGLGRSIQRKLGLPLSKAQLADLPGREKPLSRNTKLIISKMLKQSRNGQKVSAKKHIQKLNIKDIFKGPFKSQTVLSCRAASNTNNWFSSNSIRRLEHTVRVSTRREGRSPEVVVLRSISPHEPISAFTQSKAPHAKTSIQGKPAGLVSLAQRLSGQRRAAEKAVVHRPKTSEVIQTAQSIFRKTGKEVVKKEGGISETFACLRVSKERILSIENSENSRMLSKLLHKTDQLLSINKTLQNISYNNLPQRAGNPLSVPDSLKNLKLASQSRKTGHSARVDSEHSEGIEGSFNIKLGLKIPSKDLCSHEKDSSREKSSAFLNTLNFLNSKSSLSPLAETEPREALKQAFCHGVPQKEPLDQPEHSATKRESILIQNQKFDDESRKKSPSAEKSEKRPKVISFQRQSGADTTEPREQEAEGGSNQVISLANLREKSKDEDSPCEWEKKEVMIFRQELPEQARHETVGSERVGEVVKEGNPFKESDGTFNTVKISYLTSQLQNSEPKPKGSEAKAGKDRDPWKMKLNFKKLKTLEKRNTVNYRPRNQAYIYKKILETVCPMNSKRGKSRTANPGRAGARGRPKKNYSQKFSKLGRRGKTSHNKENRARNAGQSTRGRRVTLQLKRQQKKIDQILNSFRVPRGYGKRENKSPFRQNSTLGENTFRRQTTKGVLRKTRQYSTIKASKSGVKKVMGKFNLLRRHLSLKNRKVDSHMAKSKTKSKHIARHFHQTVDMSRRTPRGRFGQKLQSRLKQDFIKRKLNRV